MTRYDTPSARLAAISRLIAEALELADEGEEFIIGAKLSDALASAQVRLDAVGRGELS